MSDMIRLSWLLALCVADEEPSVWAGQVPATSGFVYTCSVGLVHLVRPSPGSVKATHSIFVRVSLV